MGQGHPQLLRGSLTAPCSVLHRSLSIASGSQCHGFKGLPRSPASTRELFGRVSPLPKAAVRPPVRRLLLEPVSSSAKGPVGVHDPGKDRPGVCGRGLCNRPGCLLWMFSLLHVAEESCGQGGGSRTVDLGGSRAVSSPGACSAAWRGVERNRVFSKLQGGARSAHTLSCRPALVQTPRQGWRLQGYPCL